MIKHIWSVLCERISADQHTNLVSYLSCIESIEVNKLPITMQNLSWGSRFYNDGKSEEHFKIQLLLVSPDKKVDFLLKPSEGLIRTNNHRIHVILNGITFKQAGNYLFMLQIQENKKWITLQEIPFNVSLKTKEQKKDKPKRERKKDSS